MTQFDDPAVEAAFQASERRARLPHVRIYIGLAVVVMLAYAVINPLFFMLDDEIRFSVLLGVTFAVLAGWFAATFWEGYVARPMIDFAALLAFAMLVTADNMLLFRELERMHQSMSAAGGINRLIVSAFAAVVLAGRTRLFIGWLGCHFLFFIAMMIAAGGETPGMIYAVLNWITGSALVLFVNWALGRAHRATFAMGRALDAERAKNEDLLHNVLPPAAAAKLKDGQVVADSYSDASVIFIDVVGFSMLAKKVSPGHLIELLNAFFSLADECAARCGVEKVKTIGDAYLAISGGNAPAANSADAAIDFGRAVLSGLPELRAATGIDLQLRIGIHSGPVVGGVIGATRMAYDYWGETMNIAARVEGTAQPGGIAVSETTFMRARRTDDFDSGEALVLKGVGETQVYRTRQARAVPIALVA